MSAVEAGGDTDVGSFVQIAGLREEQWIEVNRVAVLIARIEERNLGRVQIEIGHFSSELEVGAGDCLDIDVIGDSAPVVVGFETDRNQGPWPQVGEPFPLDINVACPVRAIVVLASTCRLIGVPDKLLRTVSTPSLLS